MFTQFNTFKVDSANFTSNDVNHLLTDGLDLGMLGVARLSLRLLLLLGEADAEDSEEVTVGGLNLNVSLDQ